MTDSRQRSPGAGEGAGELLNNEKSLRGAMTSSGDGPGDDLTIVHHTASLPRLLMSLCAWLLPPGTACPLKPRGKAVTVLRRQERALWLSLEHEGRSPRGACQRECLPALPSPQKPQEPPTAPRALSVVSLRSITVKENEQNFRASCLLPSGIWRRGGFSRLQPSQQDEQGQRRPAPSCTFPEGTFAQHSAGLKALLPKAPLSQHPEMSNLRVAGSGRKTTTDLIVELLLADRHDSTAQWHCRD